MHAGANLPMPVDQATAVLGLGAIVFAVVAYDLYRRHLSAGGDGWR